MKDTFKIPKHTCPYCGKVNDAATRTSEEPSFPSAGALTVCFGCGEWSIFEADFSLRKPTDSEEATLWEDFHCVRTKAAVKRLLHKKSAEDKADALP